MFCTASVRAVDTLPACLDGLSVRVLAEPYTLDELLSEITASVINIDRHAMGAKGGKPTRTIRELRRERGWTQYELATKVGVQAQTIYFWESGRRTPRVAHIRKLGQVFKISSDEIRLEPKPTVPQVSSPAIAEERSCVFSVRQPSNTVRGVPQTRPIVKD